LSADEPAEESPRPTAVDGGKSKKKRRRPAPEPVPDEVDEANEEEAEESVASLIARDARAADLPSFAAGFPSDPALDALLQAFEQGDYGRVRREAPALARRTDQPEVRKAARELARRLDPDPIAVYLLVTAVVLLVFLAVWYWTHPHEAPL
jgi:hypothetical protein